MKAFRFAFMLILSGLLLSACGPSAEQLTATAVMAQAQTETAAPTFTPTPTATVTLTPTVTVTLTPTSTHTSLPTATPSSLGATVKYRSASLEVNAMWSQTHTHIVPGGIYYYYSKPGRIYVEMGILVRNTGDKPVKYRMENIFLIDESGTTRSPDFGVTRTVDIGVSLDPAGLKIPSDPLDGDEEIIFEKDTYMRLFFYVKDKQTFIFRLFSSPPFTFDVNK